MRFAVAGGTVAGVYLCTTLFLANVVGLYFQVALAIGVSVAMVVQFTLQRVFVWSHHGEFALPMRHQFARYVLVVGVQYGLTAASTAVLPKATGIPIDVIYVLTVLILAAANFLWFRNRVFHAKPSTVA